MAEVKNYFQLVATISHSTGAAAVEEELARLDINKDKVVCTQPTRAHAQQILFAAISTAPSPNLLGNRCGLRSSGKKQS